ncbi:uncharacterized protein LOC142331130 isoform X2 [Lycorma delicatula]|uniref:uncharacterized protein LOC142331130 isoform X2 n=1 Tax=Lycorma delicatula TaxID=130591 RepID=UPI003F510809
MYVLRACEQLEDGKIDNLLIKILDENTSLIDYAGSNLLIDDLNCDLASLLEETVKTTPIAKIIEIETLNDGNEFQVRGMVENSENENPSGQTHFIKIKQIKGAAKPTKTWECGICKKEFQHHYTLIRHLPTHTDVRKYICKVCGKAFRQMSTLSQHKAIHTNIRPHVCEICKKAFNRISTLISHRRTHSETKPHKCPICDKGFHQKGNMRNHVFTHTNERPYKCDICYKGFNQMSNLVCHKLHVHEDMRAKFCCETCGMIFEQQADLKEHKVTKQHTFTLLDSKYVLSNTDNNKENSNFDECFSSCLIMDESKADNRQNIETGWNQIESATNNNFAITFQNGVVEENLIDFNQAAITARSISYSSNNGSAMLAVIKKEGGSSQLVKVTPFVKQEEELLPVTIQMNDNNYKA